jgi:hypothetical protein
MCRRSETVSVYDIGVNSCKQQYEYDKRGHGSFARHLSGETKERVRSTTRFMPPG